jgi:integrase/recombinase XerD
LQTGVSDDRASLTTAAARDRRHDPPQHVREHAKAYIRAVANFSKHFGRSPDKLTFEHVREYQLHLVSRGLQAATIIPIMCAIRFFYGATLGRPNVAEHIPLARKAYTFTAVLTRDQVVRFLKALPDLEMRTLFIVIYSAGLRISEAVALTARDIDSANMVVHVRQGKGRKDRYVMPSEKLLTILRSIGRLPARTTCCSPAPTQNGPSPYGPCSGLAAKPCASPVSIRRLPSTPCGTVLHPPSRTGVDIRVIQDLLGHRHITSTTRYARGALNTIRQIQSPLELLNAKLTPPT